MEMKEKPHSIRLVQFKELSLTDSFFDSLRESYSGFDEWFKRKENEKAYVLMDPTGIQAFLYLKIEDGPIEDISPSLNVSRCLKVGTFKIVAHGTKLGERFVKKIFDHATIEGVSHVYVTIFDQHLPLIRLLEKFGFCLYGSKKSSSGTENVYIKDFSRTTGDVLNDYPVIDSRHVNKWLVGIFPKWHTALFPDSILKTENSSIIEDVSYTNSIRKVYIGWMKGMHNIKPLDVIVIYRAAGNQTWFKSVATSICVVEDIKKISSFQNKKSLIKYAEPHSVFTEAELSYFFESKKHGQVIKMTYNMALPRRPIRKVLVEDAKIPHDIYWGFHHLTNDQFSAILNVSNAHRNIVKL